MNEITFSFQNQRLTVPNSWEGLTPTAYVNLVEWLTQMMDGRMTYDQVRILLLCDIAGWNLRRIADDEETMAALLAMAERITFPLNEAKEPGEVSLLNLCWFAQLLPSVEIDGHAYKGYRADLCHGTIYSSLTALQYIEARELLSHGDERLPLMAAILYCPAPYDSGTAMMLADQFRLLPRRVLTAIQWNFVAVNTFLMTRTPFELLTRFSEKPTTATIATDATDALYDLCADGIGSCHEVEQLNVLTYLRLLRKKTIDGVRQMRQAKMDTPTIATETGLPLETVNEIV